MGFESQSTLSAYTVLEQLSLARKKKQPLLGCHLLRRLFSKP